MLPIPTAAAVAGHCGGICVYILLLLLLLLQQNGTIAPITFTINIITTIAAAAAAAPTGWRALDEVGVSARLQNGL